MCSRYHLKDPKAALDFFEVTLAIEIKPGCNIAPAQKISAVTVTGAGEIQEMVRGITPAWVRKTSKALINARCGTVRENRRLNPHSPNDDV
jgi:putative SOS response-associated peptidase YedK